MSIVSPELQNYAELCSWHSWEPGVRRSPPHDNFKRALYETVGHSMDNVPPYEWPHKEDFIDTTPLPNGHVAYRYQYLRSCRYIFEVDPATHLIVGARFEGKDTDCVINP